MSDTDPGYTPLFAPDAAEQPFDPDRAFRLGDRRSAEADPLRYVFSKQITLAVNVALAAGRPLLVRGHPGTGKSSLAPSVADLLGWRFYSATVSSRTTARDLQWSFDTIARLADAETGAETLRPRAAYLTPGPLWWAFDRPSAERRGVAEQHWAAEQANGVVAAADPSPPGVDPSMPRDPERAVVLVDEIDKADPDVPNDLLQPLGSFTFPAEDGTPVKAKQPPLVVITTNEERDLPRAFLRRCVILTLEQPDPVRLKQIATVHADGGVLDEALFESVLEKYQDARRRRIDAKEPPPSVAELLDVLAACQGLATGTAKAAWDDLALLLLEKATSIPPEKP